MYLTTNKILAKERLKLAGLPTPEWLDLRYPEQETEFDQNTSFIVKPVWEDASVGIEGQAVIFPLSDIQRMSEQKIRQSGSYFAERYIEGREFNISLLASPEGPDLLPVAEIRFVDFPADMPHIVDYRAKWEYESFEYTHTVRNFDFSESDTILIRRMRDLARQCWRLFDLRGYARVDFRVDHENTPWILEINPNPCISPDSGFVAAAERAGLHFNNIIARIINDIPHFQTGKC
jgi:D-alanine-D-alanine ligase